jgi:hypothetical protein
MRCEQRGPTGHIAGVEGGRKQGRIVMRPLSSSLVSGSQHQRGATSGIQGDASEGPIYRGCDAAARAAFERTSRP